MAVEMISVKCPECGAPVEMDQYRRSAVCEYCGTRIIMHDDNTISIRDEAEIIQAETEQAVKLNQIELRAHRQKIDSIVNKKNTKRAIAAGVIGLVLVFIIGPIFDFLPTDSAGDNFIETLGGFGVTAAVLYMAFYVYKKIEQREREEDEYDAIVEHKIKLPSELHTSFTLNYQTAEDLFREAGFTDITTIPLRDLTKRISIYKPDTIETVTINGKQVTDYSKRFAKDAKVVISYHSYK